MARRVWIIPSIRQDLIDIKAPLGAFAQARRDAVESAMEDARLNNCPEIVWGIPPVLEGIITEEQLPCCYIEPEPQFVPKVKEVGEIL